MHDSKAEVAKTEDGRARFTTSYLRGLPRDEGGGPGAGVAAPAAVPVPPRPDGVQDQPMDAREASRKLHAEDAGHEADDAGRGVEVLSPIQDRWLATACPSSGGRPRRSEPMLWHWRRRVRRGEPATSWRIRIECRCGNGSAFGMGL